MVGMTFGSRWKKNSLGCENLKKKSGWFGNPTRHHLSALGIPTTKKFTGKREDDIIDKVLIHQYIDIDRNDVVDIFEYKGYPIVIVDTWDFGGIWQENNDAILLDYTSYTELSPKHIQYILDHEIVERELAENDFGKQSHSKTVAKYHEIANEIVSAEYSYEDIKSFYEDMCDYYDKFTDLDDYEIEDYAKWHLRGALK
ncbi:hypothetical protein AKJ51_01450 [candidate division MSBL1 archaeon SCGC-AAA382A20]|uniref:Uncharacterized protein n=1 Tax=candidate division MSBL1 archaeon SCGC-AAA382A20 TaxID=1698280 RepID=A0A133VLQ0_9EURY|nr:hypothetical protein AKJ51_01450 [candidate division MSBL1 archaeon SCGC-AAA382A20]